MPSPYDDQMILVILPPVEGPRHEFLKMEYPVALKVLDEEYHQFIYKNPGELAKKHAHKELLSFYDELIATTAKGRYITKGVINRVLMAPKVIMESKQQCAQMVWRLGMNRAQSWHEYSTGTGKKAIQSATVERLYKCIYVPEQDPLKDVAFIRFPKQAQVVIHILLFWPPGTLIRESQVYAKVMEQKALFKIKEGVAHDAWRIFRYYRPFLISKNFLRVS